MTDFENKFALINLTFSSYLRRRILELEGSWPDSSELHSTLSRIFTEHFHNRMTDRIELSLKMFATLIDVNLTRYAHALPKYDIIEFIEFAEKCVKDELKSAPRWCHTLIHNDDE